MFSGPVSKQKEIMFYMFIKYISRCNIREIFFFFPFDPNAVSTCSVKRWDQYLKC